MGLLFGNEIPAAGKYLLAFIIIFALLALLALVLRRLTKGRLKYSAQNAARTRQPRLGLVDTYDLDGQRQLILVRRDNVEHLVMIGGPNDVVVEMNIVRTAAGRVAAPALAGEERPADRPTDRPAAAADHAAAPEAARPRSAAAEPVPARAALARVGPSRVADRAARPRTGQPQPRAPEPAAVSPAEAASDKRLDSMTAA